MSDVNILLSYGIANVVVYALKAGKYYSSLKRNTPVCKRDLKADILPIPLGGLYTALTEKC